MKPFLKLYCLLPLLLLLQLPLLLPLPRLDIPALLRQSLLDSLNQERAAAGLAPLRLDDTLNQVAQQSAAQVRDRNAEPPRPEDIREIRIRIARGPASVEEVMSAWMQSHGHRNNLLNPAFREMGVGCAVGSIGGIGDTVLWVQDFGRPTSPRPPG